MPPQTPPSPPHTPSPAQETDRNKNKTFQVTTARRHGFKLLSHLSPPSLLQEGKMVFDFLDGLFDPFLHYVTTSCEGREREGGGREDPLVDVRYEDTANEHNWPSFPEPSCVHMLLSWRRPLRLGGPHTNTV